MNLENTAVECHPRPAAGRESPLDVNRRAAATQGRAEVCTWRTGAPTGGPACTAAGTHTVVRAASTLHTRRYRGSRRWAWMRSEPASGCSAVWAPLRTPGHVREQVATAGATLGTSALHTVVNHQLIDVIMDAGCTQSVDIMLPPCTWQRLRVHIFRSQIDFSA